MQCPPAGPAADSVVFGLDLGGTQIKALALTGKGRVLEEKTAPTNDRGDTSWRDGVRAVCDALRARHRTVAGVGVCAPGLAARDERSILSMPGRLKGLVGLEWSEFLGLPALVLNDAHAALLGESWQGAARDAENVVMVTIGTGVGGAAKVDGRLLRGHLGRAGHLGHISLNPDGAADIVGTPGSLEDAIGDCTIAARSGGRFASTADLMMAIRAGEANAAEIWQRSIRSLAAGLTSLINVLDPERIVIGGGIATAGDVLFAPLCAELDRMEWRVGASRVQIVAAQLGARAGAYGAAARALETFCSSHDSR